MVRDWKPPGFYTISRCLIGQDRGIIICPGVGLDGSGILFFSLWIRGIIPSPEKNLEDCPGDIVSTQSKLALQYPEKRGAQAVPGESPSLQGWSQGALGHFVTTRVKANIQNWCMF